MPLPKDSSSVYLTSTRDDPKIYSDMSSLWDNHSGLPELLDAVPIGSDLDRRYVFSEKTGKYYDMKTGKIVPESRLRAAVAKVSKESKLEMRKKTQQLIAGTILFSVWYPKMQSLMNTLYRTIWTLTIGGFVFETEESRNAFYLFALVQFGWLDKFYSQLERGVQPLNGAAMTRAGLYGEYGNSFYQNSLLQAMEKRGFTVAKRILGSNEYHCYKSHERLGCIELAQKGWLPIQQITPIGSAACYSNCHCHIVYR
jgi:hypothetical protein